MIIIIFIIVAVSTGTAAAADLSNNSTDLTSNNNISSSINSTSNLNNSLNITNIKISGNVTHCTNGTPFEGVTVTAKSVNGTLIAKTISDINGYYQFTFDSNESNFILSASHPGHMTVTKLVDVQQYSDTTYYYGSSNFMLGPIPTLNIVAPSEQLLNESFTFHLNFNNTGVDTGFGPMIELILPAQIQFQSASFLGVALNPYSAVFGPSGTLINPFTSLPVSGTPGSTLYILQQPLGSFASDQPTSTVDVTALLLGNSTLNVPLDITGIPIFRYGATATGDTPIVGTSTTINLTPTVIKLTKSSSAPESETVTGENYKITYTLTVDVANGQTINNVYVTDIIPGNLQYVSSITPTGAIRTLEPSTTIPGGVLQFLFSSITGVLGPDKTVNYIVYAPRFDNATEPVLNNITGSPSAATNLANVTGDYLNNNVSSFADYTLNLKSLAIQKSVTDITGGANSPKPTDILRYDLNFQISDYFALKNLVLYDNLGDGQSFLDWPTRDSNYTPVLNIELPGLPSLNLLVDLTNPNEFTYIHNTNTGITSVAFNISQILIDNGYTSGTGILYGGNNSTGYYGATGGSLTFWSQIQPYYQGINPPNLQPIVSNDAIVNNVSSEAQLLNNNNVSDVSGSRVTIIGPNSNKSILKINGNDPIGPPYVIQPGDNVTFSLTVNVPTSNLQKFNLVDYLPIPFFIANQFTTGQSQNTSLPIPAPGQWRLSTSDTLSSATGVIPSLIVDASQNVLEFFYGNISNVNQPFSTVNILFTVTATGAPMDDGLYLTNLLYVNYENSPGMMFSNNEVAWIQTGQPSLNITKTATPVSQLQSGDVVTYTILINNTGHAPAYNVVVKDDLLTANTGYISSISSITASYVNGAAITGLNLMNLFTTDGLNFTSLYPIFSVDGTNNTINITYTALLSNSVYPGQFIYNTANITNYTSLPLLGSPNYVTRPISSSASVKVMDVNLNKSYIKSIDGVSTTPNLTIGEKGLFTIAVTLPGGQVHDLKIQDSLPSGLTYLSYVLDSTGYFGTLAPLTFTSLGNILNFTFTGATYTTSKSTFLINITVLANNNTAYPGSTNVTVQNLATLDWNDPGHAPINSNANVNIIQPLLIVTKTFTPSTVEGSQLVQINIRVSNNGSATAQHVIITDPLNTSGNIFDLNSVTSYDQNGFTYSYTNNVVSFSWGNIDPGQTLDFFFYVTTLNDPVIGPTYLNIANSSYWSLPWDGNSPDLNSRNYTSTGSATLRTGDPTIGKNIFTSTIHGTTGNLAIGEYVTYRIPVTLPIGIFNNLIIVDTLPTGFKYTGVASVNSGAFTGVLPSAVVYSTGQSITFFFGGLTNSTTSNNPFYIDLEALVQNVPGNVVGNIKTNNVNLTWDENTHGPFNASVNTKLVGPNLTILKTVTPNPVDGSDKMNISLLVTNKGTSPAFEINITDLLNSTLFDPTSFTFTPVPGYTIQLNGYTVSIIGDPGTFINNTSGNNSQYFNFTVNSTANVPSNSTFTNQANSIYYSMPTSFTDSRSSTSQSNIVNIKTVAPAIAKIVDSTSEPDSTGNNVMVGEVVVYRLNLTIPEGQTLNVSINDLLPSNLIYNPNTVRIMRSNDNITATGFTFTVPAGQYEDYTGSITPYITIDLGNIMFNGADGLHNGTISIIFNATVLNINANQNGTKIPNNATFNFTNASGTIQSLTGVGPTLNTIVPNLSTTKTAFPDNVEGGQTITFTIRVSNDNNTNGAPSYNLQVLDPLVGYNNLRNIIITPSSGDIIYFNNSTSNLLNININQLNQTQYLDISYQADLDKNVTYGQKVNNTVTLTGTSLPGDHGTNNATPGNPGNDDGKRTGDPSHGAGAVNNLMAVSTATVTVRSPNVSKNINGQKNINLAVGDSAIQNIIINLPVGITNELKVDDVAPLGLELSGFGYTASTGISVNQFVITPLGANTFEFNFGKITASQEGNIIIFYSSLVQNITSNINGQNLTNNATLFYQNTTGQSVNAGSDTANIKVVEPDLIITKTSNKTNLNIGERFTYTLFVKHSSSSTSNAHNLVLTDNLPTGLEYAPGSVVLPPNWALNVVGNTLTFTSPLLSLSDNNVTITFDSIVDNDITLAGQNLTNTVNMNYTSTDEGGRDYGPITSSSQIHIIGADIAVTKTGTSDVLAGQQISYIVTIRNLGPDTATNVTFTDTFISSWFNMLIDPKYSLNGGPFTDITGNPWILSLGDMTSGNFSTIDINATVSPSASAGILNNTANATSDTKDPNPNNNNDTKLTNVTTLADLSLTKINDPSGVVTAGHNLLYTMVLTNNGPSVAQNVIFTDNQLSSYLLNRFYRYSVNGGAWSVWTGFSGPLVLNISNIISGPMGVGDSFAVMINNTVDPATPNGTIVSNFADVSSSTAPFDVVSPTVTNNVNTSAGLSISKSAAVTVMAGNKLVYTVAVTNNGPSNALNVVINDVIPVLTDLTWTKDGADQGVWTNTAVLGVMTPGQIITLLFTGTVPASTSNGTLLNNTANVTSTSDPEVHNASAITNITTMADLSILKVGTPLVLPGDTINYTIFIKNNGPSDALNVHLSDTIDPLLANPEYSLTGLTGSWDPWPPAVGYLDLNTVPAGGNVTIYLRALILQSANRDIINTATVTSPTDPMEDNSTFISHLKSADIGVTKIASTLTPNYLNNITFTITAHNYGPDQATGVSITDLIPDGFKYISSEATQGLYDANTGLWTIGNIENGNSAILTVIVQVVKTGNFTNTATKTSENEYDPNTENNKDSIIINVPQSADLSITKTVKPSNPFLHDIVNFTIIVHNNGPDKALNVYVDDLLPKGIKYISSTANYGTYNPKTGIWIIGELPMGTIAILTIKSSVEVVGPIQNHAHVYSSTYDPTINDRNATATVIVKSVKQNGKGNQQGNNIPMQRTGVPILYMLLALLLVGFGLIMPKKK